MRRKHSLPSRKSARPSSRAGKGTIGFPEPFPEEKGNTTGEPGACGPGRIIASNMKHLLNLLAAVALLVWGTHLVRAGILRVFGANLRHVLARSIGNRVAAALSGIGVTALLQSSTATALIVSSFVGQGLITLPLALA